LFSYIDESLLRATEGGEAIPEIGDCSVANLFLLFLSFFPVLSAVNLSFLGDLGVLCGDIFILVFSVLSVFSVVNLLSYYHGHSCPW
jgi:hypothetical protein